MRPARATTRQIKDIKIGDQIADAEPDSPQLQRHRVENIHVTDADRDFVDLTVTTPDGRATITTTAHHLFWNATAHAWHSAADLKSGTWLDTPRGGHAKLISSHRFAASTRTYNLTVSDVHTYYVLADRTPILVHNGAAPAPLHWAGLESKTISTRWLTSLSASVRKCMRIGRTICTGKTSSERRSIQVVQWRSTSASRE
ncbi:Hint domain-containing protein [Amycolatopsis sp. OK19-0408]|uniref:Hint domain-containing protein n=1 Tax=Amycolatopsis iheyensis TaxID=2945988 RepID=A0A9X2SN62_9PSEU|nr:Hint domain-containing protein [Amycolatopsis iheyensis]MCR6488409.1 Hint domain-containing protein [Amycolatopsis iheyensis]